MLGKHGFSFVHGVCLAALLALAAAACSDENAAPTGRPTPDGLRDRSAIPDDWNVGGSAGATETGDGGSVSRGGRSAATEGGRGTTPSSGGTSSEGGRDGSGGTTVAEGGTGDGGDGPVVVPPGPCIRLQSGEPLPARSAVMTDKPPTGDRTILTSEVFNAFRTHCGSCHAGGIQLGGFGGVSITPQNFPTLVGTSAVDRIREDKDITKVMPQGTDLKLWSKRTAGDPVVQLADLLEKWIAAGRPRDYFIVKGNSDPNTAYLFSQELGESLTNIGNCLPDPQGFGFDKADMDALDKVFAETTTLPARLDQTDLVSYDSEVLARKGVAAYAPAYPLFTDSAGKLRHVRVPRGQSFRFNASTQDFDVPKNTRFYKTFLMEVKDISGQQRWRKMETRLIVSRPDDCSSLPCKPTALMGTYKWNPEETAAELVTQPQNDGKPFADVMFTFPFDEVKAAEALAGNGDLSAAMRHYATPGRERCVNCHRGSSSKSFVLGFSPLQVVRWPYVEEPDMHQHGRALKGFGVLIESAPKQDELTQLERLIDYGIITGLRSADEVKPLGETQAQPARNGFELKAQAYILGNCAHCHNPGGLPSVLNPILTDVLNFHPLTKGGVFQFPLERTSPRTFRGELGQHLIPYITPSVYDVECPGELCRIVDGTAGYQPKWATPDSGVVKHIKAPWRSLIWRNVDSPFTYSDYFTIYPHMPMDTPGFDCRTPRIMGDWMVSIPAKPKTPVTGTEDERPDGTLPPEAQPFVEVPRSSPGYTGAVAKARKRLSEYHEGGRYTYCPDTSDIVDPEVLSGALLTPADREKVVFGAIWADNVPDRAHWLNTDATEAPGPWVPRRNIEWKGVLVDGKAPEGDANKAEQQRLIDLMKSSDLRITDAFKTWATTPRPFTHWNNPEQCSANFQANPQPTIATLPSPKPRWTERSPAKDHPNNPIFSVSPGAAVFFNVCINCHGPTGNGQSVLAATIAALTGRTTQVANLAGGVLGPIDAPGTNRQNVFGTTATQLGLTVDDLAARYLVWMALGGTQKRLPAASLLAVANTFIAGQRRPGDPTVGSANMLETGHQLCRVALPADIGRADGGVAANDFDPGIGGGRDYSRSPLIWENGDADLWETLCAYGQKTPVRVITFIQGHPKLGLSPNNITSMQSANDGVPFWDLYDPDAYGNNPVMTPHGVVNGVGNEPYTWCAATREMLTPIGKGDGPDETYKIPAGMPTCPDPKQFSPPKTWSDVLWKQERANQWALRGAMNAGLAVFSYLDAIAKGKVKPALQYNECSSLK